jgi:hypothetical protein
MGSRTILELIKGWQVTALPVNNIIYSTLDTSLIPQMDFAPTISPGRMLIIPMAASAQQPSGITLKSI